MLTERLAPCKCRRAIQSLPILSEAHIHMSSVRLHRIDCTSNYEIEADQAMKTSRIDMSPELWLCKVGLIVRFDLLTIGQTLLTCAIAQQCSSCSAVSTHPTT